jgi:hypothetical protein
MRFDSPDIIGTLTISTVNNATGDILTYSGTTVTRRTPAQLLTDIGAQVAGNYSLTSAEITAVSLTTSILTLTRASGNLTASVPTFNQNTTGSAATVSGLSGQLIGKDDRIIEPNSITTRYLQFGFTSWNNNNTAPYADYLHLRSYTDASGGNDNLIMFRKDTLGIRIWQQAYNSATAYTSFKDVAWTDGTNSTGTWPISINGSATTLTTARTLTIGSTGKTFNGSSNVSWSLTEIGAASTDHKYHAFTNNSQYFDTYAQENYLRMFTETATFDNFRFKPYTNVQFWDGSSWVTWAQSLDTLFDGREETGFNIGPVNKQFRFEITRDTGWPTTALFVLQTTWSNVTSPTCSVILETWNGSAWVQKDSWTYSAFTLGLNLKTTAATHDGFTQMRVTITLNWTPATHDYIALRRILFLSNFSGVNSLQPFTWNYSRNITFSGNITATSIIRSGGTSTQYLMADGSVSTITNNVTGTGVSGQVSFWSGTNTQIGDTSLTWDNTNKILSGRFRVNSSTNLLGSGIWGIDTALAFNVNSIERMRIDSSGNVGIGTTTPSYKTSIISTNAGVINTVLTLWNAESSSGTGARLLLQTSSNDNQYGAAIASVNELGSPNFQNASLVFQTMNNVAGFNNLTERWRITSTGNLQSNGTQTIQTSTGNLTLATAGGNGHILLSPNGTGNVGIGVSTPVNRVQINYSPVSIDSLTAISGTASTNWNRNGGILISGASISNGLAIGVSGTANDRKAWIQSGHPDTAANSLGVISLNPLGGNVLIGTSIDAGQRLQVSGNTLVTGTLEVDTINNGTGDFVTLTAGGILTRRTAAETRGDIGASSSNDSITAVSLTSTTLTLTRASGNLTASVPTFNQNTTGTASGLSATLVVGSGGTGATTLTGVVIGNGTSAMTGVAGTASQLLRRNAGNTAYEFFTHDFVNQAGARSAVSLTTTGSSGAASYSSATGVFNIPTYTLVGLGGFANPMTTLGDVIYGGASGTPTRLAGNITTAKQYLSQTGTGTVSAIPSWSTIAGADVTGAALTSTNDTNVTVTLGGTPSTALLRAASITLGWSGQLAVGRGGTGASTLTGVLIGNGTSAVTAVAGTASQLLRRNAGNTAYEFFTQTLTTISDVTITTPTNGQVLQYNGTIWVNATPAAAGVTGSGTTNYVAKFTGSTAIGNSLIFDNGTQVLVNTTTATGETFEVNGTVRVAGSYLALNSTGNDGGKLRLFGSSSEYAIGTGTSVTFGPINNNTTTNFAMPNNSAMGWRWADSGHTAAQGAMALSTNGYLTVANGIRIGYGESDTTVPTIPLDVNGNVAIQGQVYSPVNAKGNSGTGTVTFNWNDANIQSVTLTGNCTFAFSNPQSGASYQIIITQDGTGGRTITWPTIHWEARTVPTLTGTLNSKDIVTFTYDGTNYNGVISKNHGTP